MELKPHCKALNNARVFLFAFNQLIFKVKNASYLGDQMGLNRLTRTGIWLIVFENRKKNQKLFIGFIFNVDICIIRLLKALMLLSYM